MKVTIKSHSDRQLQSQIEAALQMLKDALPSEEAVKAYSEKTNEVIISSSKAEAGMMVFQDGMLALSAYLPLVASLAAQAAATLPALQAGVVYLGSQPEENQPAMRAWYLSKGGAKVLPKLAIEFGTEIIDAEDPKVLVAELNEALAEVVAAYEAATKILAEDPCREPALRAFTAEGAEDAETAYWLNVFSIGEALAEADEEGLAAINAHLDEIVAKHEAQSAEPEITQEQMDEMLQKAFAQAFGSFGN